MTRRPDVPERSPDNLPSPSFPQEVESAVSEREKLASSVETLRHRLAAFQKH